jgi:uncharacterized membrane protein/protein-disulfide isomerase
MEMERAPSEPSLPRWPLVAFLVLCVAGLAVAGDLTLIHVRVHTDPTYTSFCAISKEVNCDTVAESEYSIFLGLPNSVWGLVGYLLMGALAAWGLSRRSPGRAWPAGLLVLLSGFSVVVSIALAIVSKLVIRSMCLMCIASWMLTLALFVLAVWRARAVGVATALREDLGALLARKGLVLTLAMVAGSALAALWLFYPRYWQLDGPIGPGSLASGVDEQGHPWIGASEPKLVIYEYSDYQCPYCSRSHRELRALLERESGLRAVHLNFPLDRACNPVIRTAMHESACTRARAAICGGAQGHFWQMSDLLFLGQRRRNLDAFALAQRLGLNLVRFRDCLESPETRGNLDADMAEGRKLNLHGTPTYHIGATTYAGGLPMDRIGTVVCADAQGKLAEAADAVFVNPAPKWDPDAVARALGLDATAFHACLDSRKFLKPRGR